MHVSFPNYIVIAEKWKKTLPPSLCLLEPSWNPMSLPRYLLFPFYISSQVLKPSATSPKIIPIHLKKFLWEIQANPHITLPFLPLAWVIQAQNREKAVIVFYGSQCRRGAHLLRGGWVTVQVIWLKVSIFNNYSKESILAITIIHFYCH